MKAVLVLLMIALAIVWKKGRHHPTGKMLMIVITALSLILGIASILHHSESPSRISELRVQEACGYVLGESLIRAYPQGGTFPVLNMPDFSERVTPADAKMKGLKEAFKGHPHQLIELDLAALPMDLQSFFSRLENRAPVPEFWELIRQLPEQTALVSLVGLPPPPENADLPLFIAGVDDAQTLRSRPNWQGIKAAVQMKPGVVIRTPIPAKASMDVAFGTRFELVEFE
ncbi:hypothetical protein P3T73_03655 [Kiritimatiellota bacterium B12222]|nr:hypothetical protein P3T73_03655 [Kiritimatiellota bacterium B12222]